MITYFLIGYDFYSMVLENQTTSEGKERRVEWLIKEN
jgi:hypothetical protein